MVMMPQQEAPSIPARALLHRLHVNLEPPSWSTYLPAQWTGGVLEGHLRDKCGYVGGPGESFGDVGVLGQSGSSLYSPSSQATFPPLSPLKQHGAGSPMIPTSPASGHQPPPWTSAAASAGHAAPGAPCSPPRRGAAGAAHISSVAGHVWKLAKEADGCRQVQAVLENCDYEEQVRLAWELKGHVWEALRCPHANHVVQKCIVLLRPEASQFILDELLSRRGNAAVAQAAKHRFGCRIVERLLEKCTTSQVRPMVDSIIADAVSLATHPYGNYVVQHVVEYGVTDQQCRLSEVLADHVCALCPDTYAGAVITKALSNVPTEARLLISRAILATPGLLASMARTRHGLGAARILVQLVGDLPEERAAASRELEADPWVGGGGGGGCAGGGNTAGGGGGGSRYGRYAPAWSEDLQLSPGRPLRYPQSRHLRGAGA